MFVASPHVTRRIALVSEVQRRVLLRFDCFLKSWNRGNHIIRFEYCCRFVSIHCSNIPTVRSYGKRVTNRNPNMNGYMPPYRDEEGEERDGNGLIRTCHLCGKAQCGQRKGRVRCAFCKRVFCLQQLYKKFKIKTVPNDPNFKCPRCLGICCCVCNCQKPPPHVHCKVYKVRQNKRRNRELAARESSSLYTPPMPMVQQIAIQPQPLPSVTQHPVISTLSASQALTQAGSQLRADGDMGLQGHYYMNDAPAPAPQLPESYPISYPDPAVSNCLFYNNDIQGSANSFSS